jgi:hypothetical protein
MSMSAQPRVSFVVPCYRLAHYLRECVESILAQSYTNFEVLIMDDCSPDDTPAVAASFTDARVCHVRHAQNVGHLRNYNDGIARARGEYIWLISADDWLRSPDVLRRFVEIFDEHPNVTLAFSQAMKVDQGQDVSFYPRRASTRICAGATFLREALLDYNCVPAPAAMARKTAYLSAGLFPLDLPHSGDWYLWCRFALEGDVAYVAEPLVNYRQHDDSMSKTLTRERAAAVVADEVEVRWRIKALAEAGRQLEVARACRQAIGEDYALRLSRQDTDAAASSMTPAAVKLSIERLARSAAERRQTEADVLVCCADRAAEAHDHRRSGELYLSALRMDPWRPRTAVKCVLSLIPGVGMRVRHAVAMMRSPATPRSTTSTSGRGKESPCQQ